MLYSQMEYIRISKKFSYEAAHALLNYDRACRFIYGHSYKLEMGLLGVVPEEDGHPKNGMVTDFGELKKLVHQVVIVPWDHALLLHKGIDAGLLEVLQKNKEKLVLLPYQPNCENRLLDIRQRLQAVMPAGCRLRRLQLSETESAYAKWYAADEKGCLS